MSVPPTEATSPTDLPGPPRTPVVATEGLEISDPIDERLSDAVAQARTLFISDDVDPVDEELVPAPTVASVVLPVPPASVSTPSLDPTSVAVANASSRPPVPIIGGITLVTKDEWSAWTGGKPKNCTWTGLDDSVALLEHTSPNQLRPVYVSSAQKGYNFRDRKSVV